MTNPIRYLLVLAAIVVAIAVATGPAGQKRKAFLGLQFAPLTRAAQARAPYLTRGGALIVNVVRASAADKAGFKVGEIVTAINGKPVERAAEAAAIIDRMMGGEKAVIAYYDVGRGDRHPRTLTVVLDSAPPVSKTVFMVEPPHTLARQQTIVPGMAANAAWSSEIARGPVKPLPLSEYTRGRCSALAPEGWRIALSAKDASNFVLISSAGHLKAIFERANLAGHDPESFVQGRIAALLGAKPEASPPAAYTFDIFVVPFGTLNGYAGFALYRVYGRGSQRISLRIVAVPATEAGNLVPLTGAIALSIRCADDDTKPQNNEGMSVTSISTKCLHGACDDSDLAGAYNGELHTGYVHNAFGRNFLIDPRKDIWMTGPNGPGTYRQVGGTLEELDPGRTN